ncbi:hypothetical protein PAMP_006861 [Pampus punctatissimus]
MDDTEMEERATPSGSTSPGDAASARGESVNDEDDGLFYIPERRPSLDLGPSPMDTSHWPFVEQAMTPVLSYGSMTSEEHLHSMDEDNGFYTRVHLEKTDSYSSCYSLDSDDCEKRIPKVKSKDDTVSEPSDTLELIQEPDTIRHPSLTVDFTFKAISKTLKKLSDGEMARFKKMLWKHYPQSFNTPPQSMDMVDLVDRLLECYNLEVSLQMSKSLLEEIGKKKMVDFLEYLCIQNEVRYDLSENLRRRYGEVCEDSTIHGETRPFDDVFTDLHITSMCNNGPNIDHEVMTIKKLDTNRETGELLSTKDILSVERMESTRLKFLLITGAAGSGKSMAVRRLILDWIEKKSHQHHRKYRATDLSPDEERDFLMNLGKLALNMLEQGKFKITKTEWKEAGISEEEAVTNSGLCVQYITKPYVLFQEKVISFIHPTMQEYLAALYVFLSFSNWGKNIFEQQLKVKFSRIFKGNKAMELYRSAVDKSLLYDDGKLDIFLRFLFGMALKTNLDLLKPLCTSTVKWPTVIEDATTLIRKRITENQSPGRNDNLQRCLEELGVRA